MTTFERPADDRDDAELAAAEASDRPLDEGAICPLMSGRVQLLPLRYGLVQTPLPDIETPYTLESRSLGLRLLRNGYLYVLDGTTNELHEYEFKDHSLGASEAIGGHNGGKLEYPSDRTIHVCFSEIRWTEAKRAQVRDSVEDRDAFMQAVNLAGAGPVKGGEHLLPPYRAESLVAEFAEDYGDDEYHWENEPYFHRTRIGKLYEQHDVCEPDECLCLLVRDDIGVMRDLAQLQDNVVGWVESWTGENEGRTQRDYVLGSYIASVTQLDDDALAHLAEMDRETERQALWNDLDDLDDDVTRNAMRDYLNDHADLPSVCDPDLPADLKGELARMSQDVEELLGAREFYHGEGALHYAFEIQRRQEAAVERYYARQALRDAGGAFVNEHLDGLVRLKREQRGRVDEALEGARLGQRGINDLIDRERMDAFLEEQREKLALYDDVLEKISRDRAEMLAHGRFHTAAWYFDPRQADQIEAALVAEYACTRDICRSDDASERIFDWLQRHPEFDRPMFYGLSLAERTALGRDYVAIADAGLGLLEETPVWIDRLASLESGMLPDVAVLENGPMAVADGIRANLTPAVGVGIERVMATLNDALNGNGQLPTLDELFRHSEMPKVLGARLLDAARRGELTFVIEPRQLEEFQKLVSKIQELRRQLRNANIEVRRTWRRKGGEHPDTRQAERSRTSLRQELSLHERALALTLSPIEALPEDRVGLVGAYGEAVASNARAGITLVLPAAQHRAVGELLRKMRQGIHIASPGLNVAGDGLSLALFVAQAINLVAAYQALATLPDSISHQGRTQTRINFANALFSTGATGFLAAQSIGHTAIGHQAEALRHTLARGMVAARMGVMHATLGGVGYLFGFATAGFGLYHGAGDWLDALRRGNGRAQSGALMMIGGSAGLMGAHGRGLLTTGRVVSEAWGGGRPAWAAAGRRLGSLFLRLNGIGLLFSALQLAGTWRYNRHNLSEHDRWLQSSPWGRGSERSDRPLDDYLEALEEILQPTHATVDARYGETFMPQWMSNLARGTGLRQPLSYLVTLHLPNVSPMELLALGGQPPMRLSLKAWRLSAGIGGSWSYPRWHEITGDWIDSLEPLAEEGQTGLVLRATTPPTERRRTRYFLGIRYEWQDGRGGYRTSEQYLMVRLFGDRGTGQEQRHMPDRNFWTYMIEVARHRDEWFVFDADMLTAEPI